MYSQTRSQIDETLSPLHMSVVLFYQEYCATEDGKNRHEAPTEILKRLQSVEQKWGISTTIQIAEDFLKCEANDSEAEAVKHWSSDRKNGSKSVFYLPKKHPIKHGTVKTRTRKNSVVLLRCLDDRLPLRGVTGKDAPVSSAEKICSKTNPGCPGVPLDRKIAVALGCIVCVIHIITIHCVYIIRH